MADPESALLEGILGPLAALQRAGRLPSSTPALILLDGLCEAELHRPDYGDTIAGFLARHLDSFPAWLKVVCTIRTASKQAVRSLPFHTIRYGKPKAALSLLVLSVLRIRIRRIHMFLGLLNPDLLVRDRYESGSGSFYHQAKIVRKTLIPTVL
jgi:hypothetical protein